MDKINIQIIVDYMQQHKLNKAQFCDACGISIYTLNKILKNESIRKITPFIKMALYMKVKLKDLLYF